MLFVLNFPLFSSRVLTIFGFDVLILSNCYFFKHLVWMKQMSALERLADLVAQLAKYWSRGPSAAAYHGRRR
jgi:hypothetical protein